MVWIFIAKTFILSLFFASIISILRISLTWAEKKGWSWIKPFLNGVEDMDAGFLMTWMVLFILFLIIQML